MLDYYKDGRKTAEQYQINKITDHNGVEKDEKRVGRICERPALSCSYPAFLIAPYIEDKDGSDLTGKALKTSPVTRVIERRNEIEVRTINSIYYFQKIVDPT